MGSPVELIRYDDYSRKFHVGEDAVEVLKQVPGPVGVVAVCGRARSGKSYILNLLLKASQGEQSTGFQVSPTTKPCTKGLWMWSTPQEVQVDDQKYHMVLLDTEGIEAYDQTNRYSTQIFCLAVLLSSLFVYNHHGTISEGDLDKLGLITEMTNLIRTKTEGETTAEELGQFTPKFLWLLRDFYLQFDKSHNSPMDYLNKDVFLEREGEEYEGKNQVRRRIKQLFPQQDVCTLVRPVNDESQLQQLQSLPDSELRPDFLQGLVELQDKVMKWSKPQKYKGMQVTGPILAALVETYVDAMNHGAVPNIGSAWQGVQESECRRALDEAEKVYKAEFHGDNLPPEDAEFQREHERAFSLALKVFEGIAVGNASSMAIKEAHMRRLVETCDKHCAAAKRYRTLEAEKHVSDLLYNAQAQMRKVLGSGSASLPELETELKQFLEMYQATAAGPSKWQKLAEFLRDTFFVAAKELLQGVESRAKQQLDEADQKLQEAEQQLAQLNQKLSESSVRASEANSLKSELMTLRTEYETKCKTYESKMEKLQAQLRDTIAFNQKTSKSAADAAKAQSVLAENQLTHMKNALEAKEHEAEQLKKHVEGMTQRCHSLESIVQSSKAEVEQLDRTYAETSAQVAAKDHEIADLQQQVIRLQADVAAAVVERDQARAGLSQHQSRQQQFASTLDDQLAEAQQEAHVAASSRSTGRRSEKGGWNSKTTQELRAILTEAGHQDKFWNQNWKKADFVEAAQELLGDCTDS